MANSTKKPKRTKRGRRDRRERRGRLALAEGKPAPPPSKKGKAVRSQPAKSNQANLQPTKEKPVELPPVELMDIDLLSSTFQVLVDTGGSRQMFCVHENMVTKRSELFRLSRQKNWDSENEAKKMMLEENAHVFSAYLHTVYFGARDLEKRTAQATARAIAKNLRSSEDEEQSLGEENDGDPRHDVPNKNPVKAEAETATFLVDLYILTDKLLDPITANIVMDELVEFLGSRVYLVPAVTTKVYASTRNGSMLRLLMRDLYIHDAKRMWPSKAQPWNLPYTFLQDFVVETVRLQTEKSGDSVYSVFWDYVQNRKDAGRFRFHQSVGQE